MGRIVGVVGLPIHEVVSASGASSECELRRVGFAQQDRPAAPQPGNDRGVLLREERLQAQRARRCYDALGLERVLDGEGNPVQGPQGLPLGRFGVSRLGLGPGAVGTEGNHGVDLRVHGVDLPQAQVHQFRGGDFPLADHPAQLGG